MQLVVGCECLTGLEAQLVNGLLGIACLGEHIYDSGSEYVVVSA